jgi:hypothetical protein
MTASPPPRRGSTADAARDRGQSHVVGVALLLGVAVIALAALTATIGAVVESNAARADAARVAADFDGALDPVETTGRDRGRVSFTEGELRPVDRDLRVLNASGTVRRVRVDALVYAAGSRRVAFLAGAVVRGTGAAAEFRTPPPITASRSAPGTGVLVVGAARLGSPAAVSGTGGVRVALRTDVSHARSSLGEGRWRVAVETATPGPWRAFFDRQGATVRTRDLDGDGLASVVADYPGRRAAYLVVHDLDAEVAG